MDKKTFPISPTAEPDHLFLISEKNKYSYGELFSFSEGFSAFLREYEINADRPLGLHASSSDALIFMIATCWIRNIPFVPFDPTAKQDLLAAQIKSIKPGLIISDSGNHTIPAQIRTIPIDTFNISETINRNEQFDESTSSGAFHHEPDNIFGYFFTSGTSGNPKIVPLKRRQMHAGAKASATNLKPKTNEAWLLCLPLNHIGGISIILRSLLYGSAIYRSDDFKKVETAAFLTDRKNIVAASLVPTMLKRLLQDEDFSTHDTFKAILLGGGPISSQLLQVCIDRGIPVISSYGMTETCAQIAANPLLSVPDDPATLGSAGRVFSPNDIEIRDGSNHTLPAGSSGAVWLKGPHIFDGYHNQPNRNYFDKEGWFSTGDFGRLDQENRLYIEARRTDLIITGGENVAPAEVEAALKNIDYVKEAAVFGIPDPEWGQKVAAAIILKDEKVLSENALHKSLKKQLEPYKIPKDILVVQSLPRTKTGKIKRGDLPKLYQSK